MAYPQHPDTVILKNEFYPRGLREIDIWNYYIKNKRFILESTRGHDLMFYIMAEENRPIIKRRIDDKGYIRLDHKNYETYITGRTLSIHKAMNLTESFGIVDVDIDPSDGFAWAKKVTLETYNYVMDKMPIVRKASINYTGKTSFHIICDFERKMKIEGIQFLLEKFLRTSPLAKAYTIGGRRRPGIPNLDLNRNVFRANHIALHALSVWGLKCMEVPYISIPILKARVKQYNWLSNHYNSNQDLEYHVTFRQLYKLSPMEKF